MSYNTYSNPSDLRITDIRFVDIDGAPKRCTLLKIMTNQGIEGYGEVTARASEDDPTVCEVEFPFAVAHGLNQIYLTAHITV